VADNKKISASNEYLPEGEISERWAFLLEAMEAESKDEDREKRFLYTHGYLRGLADAGLVTAVGLEELREELIKAKSKRN